MSAWLRRRNVWSRSLLGKETARSHKTETERRCDRMSMGVVMDAAP